MTAPSTDHIRSENQRKPPAASIESVTQRSPWLAASLPRVISVSMRAPVCWMGPAALPCPTSTCTCPRTAARRCETHYDERPERQRKGSDAASDVSTDGDAGGEHEAVLGTQAALPGDGVSRRRESRAQGRRARLPIGTAPPAYWSRPRAFVGPPGRGHRRWHEEAAVAGVRGEDAVVPVPPAA